MSRQTPSKGMESWTENCCFLIIQNNHHFIISGVYMSEFIWNKKDRNHKKSHSKRSSEVIIEFSSCVHPHPHLLLSRSLYGWVTTITSWSQNRMQQWFKMIHSGNAESWHTQTLRSTYTHNEMHIYIYIIKRCWRSPRLFFPKNYAEGDDLISVIRNKTWFTALQFFLCLLSGIRPNTVYSGMSNPVLIFKRVLSPSYHPWLRELWCLGSYEKPAAYSGPQA